MSVPAAKHSAPTRGEIWIDRHGPAKVMAVVDNYVVFRRKGAAPDLEIMRAWLKLWRRALGEESK